MFINVASAEGLISQNPSGSSVFFNGMDFNNFILMAISIIVLFAGIFSILYILWGGILLILSGGKDDKIKPAINSIRYALIGLAVIVLSIFIFPRVAALLGLDATSYSSPDKIFAEIKRLGDKIFGNDSSSIVTPSGNVDVNSLPTDFSDL